MSNKTNFFIILSIVFLTSSSRLINHPYNFTPIMAMSIFSGCFLIKTWAIVFPVGAMLISDYFIGFYNWQVMVSIYLSIGLAFVNGWILKKHFRWFNVFLASLFSSLLFFIITNFSIWYFLNWYPHTLQGFINCYMMALPFFRNNLLSDLFYSTILFGVYELLMQFSDKKLLSLPIGLNRGEKSF